MFQDALSQKRGLFAVFRRRKNARAAAMLRGGETLFFDNTRAIRIPAGRKLAGSAARCVAIVPEDAVFYKLVSVPATEDAAVALKEAVAALPLRAEDDIWEYFQIHPLAAEPGHKDFALWAASRKYLADCRKSLQAAGIGIVDFLPESVGLVKTVFPSLETGDAALIMSVSADRSVFTVFAGRAIHLSGALPFGSKALESSEGEAEDRFLSEIMQAVLWYKNRAFHEHGASHSINKIVLLGHVPKRTLERIALNTQLRVDIPDVLRGADAAFAPLVGALKR